jgi:hypothetical protein
MDWSSFLAGFVSGGLGLRLIDYCIAFARERREQKDRKLSHEKDKPRFRIDVAIVPTAHSSVPAAVVKILSLGSLPITINQGEVFIEATHYPEHVQSTKLDGREIGPIYPIEVKFPLPDKLMNPSGVGEPVVKIVCEFSYDKGQPYKETKTYNRRNRTFE